MFACGYQLSYRMAKTSFSRYIVVANGDLWFKVRFSNHRELDPDCDISCDGKRYSVHYAIIATIAYLEQE